jgi:hypothetical protein
MINAILQTQLRAYESGTDSGLVADVVYYGAGVPDGFVLSEVRVPFTATASPDSEQVAAAVLAAVDAEAGRLGCSAPIQVFCTPLVRVR